MAYITGPGVGPPQQQQHQTIQTPTMTISFKMDITTSGTHNGLFITTGIQNGQNGQMNQFGFVQPTNANQLMNASQLSLAPATTTPTPIPFLTQGKVLEDARKEEATAVRTSFPSTSTAASILNESQPSIVVSPPSQRKTITTFANSEPPPSIREEVITEREEFKETIVDGNKSTSRLSVAQQTQQRVESPAPSLRTHTTDEFLKNVPFKINTFQEEARPYVQYPTDLVLNDTTTTTTTVEVFRANADDNVDYYKLPPAPADTNGKPQLISARGPAYEVHTNTETRFSDNPLNSYTPLPYNQPQKSVQWDTKEPVKFLDDWDRPDSRYGSHGSIDTILRKQWIENKTETLTRTTSPSFGQGRDSQLGQGRDSQLGQGRDSQLGQERDSQLGQGIDGQLGQGMDSQFGRDSQLGQGIQDQSFGGQQHFQNDPLRGSQRSLLDNSKESTSFALLDSQTVEPKRYMARVEEGQQRREMSSQSQDPRSKYYEKRRRSPHHSQSPVRYEKRAGGDSARYQQRERGRAEARQPEAVKPRQAWEYSSAVQRQPRSQQQQVFPRGHPSDAPPPYSSQSLSTRQRHHSTGAIIQQQPLGQPRPIPSLQEAEDYVERPPRQNCRPFTPKSPAAARPTARTRSKSPPTAATEYGRPTLVYTPRDPTAANVSFVEDDYYGNLREEQYRRGRTRSGPQDRSRSPSPWEWERPESPNYRMGNRPESANHKFHLYQTRDCLGNVLYEFERPDYITTEPPHQRDQKPLIHSSGQRRERPISQHSYQTLSNRSSRNLEDAAKFDEYNNVRLVADGAKLHIVQEGKV